MCSSRFFLALLSVGIVFLMTGTIISSEKDYFFDPPIDGLSMGVETDVIDLAVSAQIDKLWSAWSTLEIEKEFDPLLRESNLLLFPKPISHLRIRGKTTPYVLHPIRISHEPIRYTIAARLPLQKPHILSRIQWGADESLLFTGRETQRSDVNHTTPSNGFEEIPDRVKECEELQKRFPQEFRSHDRTLQDPEGKRYRWPLEFSPSVHLLVVHHTALAISGDPRPPVERVRALYQYHANNRGWGDIGYNFLIDEEGQIYEGRAGGDFVVGGHAYCHNVGSMGIALLGNFDQEKPPLPQIQSLQWLLRELAEKYDINLQSRVRFHGKTLPPIVGHQALVSTDCPGYYVYETLDQIRHNVTKGDIKAAVVFPEPLRKYVDHTDKRRTSRMSQINLVQKIQRKYGIFPIGSTKISARPGQSLAFSVRFVSEAEIQERQRLASIQRSHKDLILTQEIAGADSRLRDALLAPHPLQRNEEVIVRMTLHLPEHEGSYLLTIGDVKYVFDVSGRRLRKTAPRSLPPEKKNERPQKNLIRLPQKTPTLPKGLPIRPAVGEPTIRIHLSYPHSAATLASPSSITINGEVVSGGEFILQKKEDSCVLLRKDTLIAKGIVRITPKNPVLTITSWDRSANRFRGTVECRIIDAKLTLINELALEDYLAGLAEEPDSQPYEKQRAFAIAARTYAAHYMQEQYRKFPGMPYDGSDNPAEFQAYGGVVFEEANPQWIQAVQSTAGKVLMKDGEIIRAAYFSSDDGRTRSPQERGWQNFPSAEVFVSKPDPWCKGLSMHGHGVGMSGCGAGGQAREGKNAEEILEYYYPGIELRILTPETNQ
ncbi:hypothetical protein A2635_00855 [Candidatus Peribacteria bacterium RIFCSPHIGHO2_01_FULL_51_9]|nr:MAG: hypothetical protein A2635_00855 [Candidatus Peribacteria bacterium RIFCSPHIGHO2_01_FULL_51_9]